MREVSGRKKNLLSIVFVLSSRRDHCMYNLDNNQKNTSKVTSGGAAMLLLLSTLLLLIASVTTPLALPHWMSTTTAEATTEGFIGQNLDLSQPKAPVVVSANNIYIAWWTNNTENGNEEVMFRASNDGGSTFGDKINLSNMQKLTLAE
jgi:hypothetical protein